MKISAIAAVAVMAGVAGAETVDLAFINPGYGRNVTIAGPGPYTGVFAGQLKFDMDGKEITTFCIEVAEPVTKATTEYHVLDIAQVPGEPGPMEQQRADALSRLYDAAADAQFGTDHSTAAAFQVAVWEIVFDFDGTQGSIDFNNGEFKLLGDGGYNLAGIAGAWLSGLGGNMGGGMTQLAGLYNDGKQDQVVMVPLPAPVAMGLAGLLAVAGVRRLRTR